ncbi:MAG TPA: zf-TFIIB domain-containing protein [Sedimentisphaerales bacterium]|nr:zf-TFIIB domain-containing protein [Sedimentisphaerales bacterium]
MNCPACKNAMITLEMANVEIDYCVSCGGVWLDSGEPELLMDAPEKAGQLLRSFREDTAGTEQPRRCPICDKRMSKILVGQATPPLRIDQCRRGHGLWFDRGELEDILRRGQLDPEDRILRLLADMLGKETPHTAKDS